VWLGQKAIGARRAVLVGVLARYLFDAANLLAFNEALTCAQRINSASVVHGGGCAHWFGYFGLFQMPARSGLRERKVTPTTSWLAMGGYAPAN
jgi:hypothetical protein